MHAQVILFINIIFIIFFIPSFSSSINISEDSSISSLPPIRVAALLNACFYFGWLILDRMRSRDLFVKSQLLALSFDFFIQEKNVYLWLQRPWILDFWPTDEFQGKFLTNGRVSKNRRSSLYPISVAKEFPSEM